jgi:hypothetical protein
MAGQEPGHFLCLPERAALLEPLKIGAAGSVRL